MTCLEPETRIATFYRQTCSRNQKNHRKIQMETTQCHSRVNLIAFYVFLSPVLNSHCSVTIILKFTSSLRKHNKYSFEKCIQNLTTLVMLATQKLEVTKFLHCALEGVFHEKIDLVLRRSVGARKKPNLSNLPKWPKRVDLNFDFLEEKSVFSNIYIHALLNKIAPEEELILSHYSEYKKEPDIFVSETECLTEEEAKGIVKKARELFREIARKRMITLDNLPDYSLWSQDFNPDEMANLLKLLCENFKKDLEILWNKIRNFKE